ncbi:PA2778 family cysteine peptidase [Mariprofundus ferrooxydans]|uniref:PA2778 family cysteine peptidase n=1 Tax=Mariprofundus ferrooxydans TaxID=314344 RepID=UPI00036D6817|nr:PA2778 family cysteine peptidase [Mariprofundus ferrooxydans]
MAHVPFFAQSEYQCGPAALAMMLNWAMIPVTPEQLSPKLFIPDKKGSLQIEMMAVPRQYGILAYPLAPQLADLLHEVSAGHPVLVFQNLALSWYPQWHYAVVVAYDLQNRTITLHSGLEAEHRIPLSTFEHTWARAGYWAMLALPPGNLPATAEETRLMKTAAILENAKQPQAAIVTYQAALKRWPDSLAARMGIGNSYYALKQIDKAGEAFYQATIDHPHAAVAFNNLAQVYLEQHQLNKAQNAIQQAIRLDGESPVYRETEAVIRKETDRQY